jgi:hypothetical protein
MMKVLMERELPSTFDVSDDVQAARHARIAVDAIATLRGKMRWICTYATESGKLFGLVEVADQATIDEYVRRAGIGGAVKVHKVLRTLDATIAAPKA